MANVSCQPTQRAAQTPIAQDKHAMFALLEALGKGGMDYKHRLLGLGN